MTIIIASISLIAVCFIVLYFFSAKRISKLTADSSGMIEKLKELQAALEEAKIVSEIKINARTRELRELADGLEEMVKQRTQELQAKLEELERFQRLAVGRELKMIELKQKIEKLEKNAKKN